MKIVLRESIENLGTAGEIVEVKGGYARNFLLPKGLALAATPANLKVVEINRKREDARHLRLHDDAESLAQKITATT